MSKNTNLTGIASALIKLQGEQEPQGTTIFDAPIGALPTKPLEEIETPSVEATKREGLAVNLNFGQPTDNTAVNDTVKEKNYILYGVIFFVILVVVVLIIKSRTPKK